MQINNIKINGFGNLKDKNIELKSGINVITGKNEVGKSTFLKFIPAMFYGLSKNKNGKELSDLEKYRPWHIEEFSGKLQYTLDDTKKYEVYRDFNKKTCKIYNENGEDITEKYGIEKSKQSLFFLEQTGITEEILMKTAISEQTETKLNKNDQNIIIQKISNVLSTGSDNISYKKALAKLKDKQAEEVGTERTVGRPINIIKNELNIYKAKEIELKNNMEEMSNYELEKENINMQIRIAENKLEFLNELKTLKEEKYLEEEKININNNSLYEYKEKIEELNKTKKTEEKKYMQKKDNKKAIILFIILLIAIVLGIIFKNIWIIIPVAIIVLIFSAYELSKKNKLKKEKEEKYLSLYKEIEILERTKKEKEIEITKQVEKLKQMEKKGITKLKYKFNKINIEENNYIFDFNSEQIKMEIKSLTEEINSLKVKINTMGATYKNILEKLEELPKIEEKIKELNEQEEELKFLNNSINLARVVLEEAYEKMKENITPEFVKNLSNIIKKISNVKYSNVKFNDDEGLIVELNNGEYVNVDKLSIGTIDQMYLSLRLASLKEIIKENIPIILDEPFVYYDEERLKNILKFLEENYSNTQIILFSCADRECKILDRENIEYNLINL